MIHHPVNLGYGVAVRSGLAASAFEYVCFTDGDDQYEVNDFVKLLKLRDRYDLIITFRYKKIYSSNRLFISWFYNKLLRFLFRTPFRDVSTGLRMVRRSILSDIELEAQSPFIGAELAIKAMLHGYRVGEVGIQTFPRTFGRGSSTSVRNIVATIADMWRIYRKIFSEGYDLPPDQKKRAVCWDAAELSAAVRQAASSMSRPASSETPQPCLIARLAARTATGELAAICPARSSAARSAWP